MELQREQLVKAIADLRSILADALQIADDYADDYVGTVDELRIRAQSAELRQRASQVQS